MLRTFRHDERVSLAQRDGGLAAVSIADGHIELAVEDQEELVGVVVDVPDVFALDLGDPDVLVVDVRDDARAPQRVEGGQGPGEGDRLVAHGPILGRPTGAG